MKSMTAKFSYGKPAAFTYEIMYNGKLLVIWDENKGGKSVTNDMESVIKTIANAEGYVPYSIVYCDSEGAWCSVRMDGVGGPAQFSHELPRIAMMKAA